jgi:hypothetical protein
MCFLLFYKIDLVLFAGALTQRVFAPSVEKMSKSSSLGMTLSFSMLHLVKKLCLRTPEGQMTNFADDI